MQIRGGVQRPLFSEIARLCLRNEEPLIPTTLPIAEENAPNPILRELAQVVAQEEPQIESALTIDTSLSANSEKALVPNYVGKHLKQVVEHNEKIGLSVKLRGQGHYVKQQFPPAGAYLNKKRHLVLFLN